MRRATSPSLAGMKAFEVVSRLKSYSSAAKEMGVTEAAIRQHIHGLEAFFGLSLVVRQGRGIALTNEAFKFAASVSSGFNTLNSGIYELLGVGSTSPLRIALTPAFAENWLMPRLEAFWTLHPDINIEMAPSIKPVDLALGQFDMAIRYGDGKWPGYIVNFLASAQYSVVASSTFLEKHKISSIADTRSNIWLFETNRTEHHVWAESNGVDFHAKRNRFYPNNSLVLSAVRAGHGISVQSAALVERNIAEGLLSEIASESTHEMPGYYVIAQKVRRKKLVTFIDWLLSV